MHRVLCVKLLFEPINRGEGLKEKALSKK